MIMSWSGGYDIAEATIQAIEETELKHMAKVTFYGKFLQALLDKDWDPYYDELTHSRAFLEAARIINVENCRSASEKAEAIEYWNKLLKIK